MFRPLISVNLLLYKPKFYLEPCLRSILAQNYENFELLIIDNNSGDGTSERVKNILDEAQKNSQRIPAYRILINQKNLGFAAAHNQGIKASRGELAVLINQDVILDNDFLEQAAKVFQSEEIGSLQPKILRLKVEGENLTKTDIIDTTGLIILKNRRVIARGQGRPDRGQYDEAGEIFGADGALPVYRRTALEDAKIKIGPKEEYFDEDFFMYKEDVDLAWRLRLYGWVAWFEPRAIAWHARTAGDSVQTGYLGIIRERLKINKSGKFHSFKNQRLMQIKNEQVGLLIRHLWWFVPKEIGAWLYVLIFEHYIWRSIKELLRLAPGAWRKRDVIMARKKAGEKEMRRWFQ